MDLDICAIFGPFSWYFGKLRRIDAEKLLQLSVNEQGAFLVRDSVSDCFMQFIKLKKFQKRKLKE